MKIARDEAAKGHQRFVVVSADADFAAVADIGTLEIIARPRQRLGKRLKERAQHVHRLPEPTTAQATPKKLKVTNLATEAATNTTDRDRPTGPQAGLGDRPALIRWRQSAPHVAAAGLGLWVAGMCVGSGMAVGSIPTRRLLHGRRRQYFRR